MIERYFYIIWTGIFFLIWLAAFLYRRDIRKEMLLVSVLFGIGGVLSEFVHIQDWWQPMTLTGTALGIEDFLIGMFIGGIASVIYEEVYGKKVKRKRGKHPHFGLKIAALFVIGMALFYGLFFALHLHSFYSAVITSAILISYILYERRDLLADSLASGLLMTSIGIAIYFILFLILPDYFQRFWYLDEYWFSATFLKIPIAEYIWYFLVGAFIGPLYEFWQGGRLANA